MSAPLRTPLERFFDKVEITDSGCWLWIASCNHRGYGQFWVDGTNVRSHGWSYRFFVGPVPEGMNLDHFVCDNTRCVNPNHMRPVTPRENVLRGNNGAAINLAKTECIHGHAFDDENTYVNPQGNRACRQCKRDWDRRYRERAA